MILVRDLAFIGHDRTHVLPYIPPNGFTSEIDISQGWYEIVCLRIHVDHTVEYSYYSLEGEFSPVNRGRACPVDTPLYFYKNDDDDFHVIVGQYTEVRLTRMLVAPQSKTDNIDNSERPQP